MVEMGGDGYRLGEPDGAEERRVVNLRDLGRARTECRDDTDRDHLGKPVPDSGTSNHLADLAERTHRLAVRVKEHEKVAIEVPDEIHARPKCGLTHHDPT